MYSTRGCLPRLASYRRVMFGSLRPCSYLDRTFDDAEELREFSLRYLAGFANFGKPLADAEIHAAVPLCVHHSPEGEHVHALRSRERGCSLIVQTLWAEKIQSTTDAGSLNTFGRMKSQLRLVHRHFFALRVEQYYTRSAIPDQDRGISVCGLALDHLSKMKI